MTLKQTILDSQFESLERTSSNGLKGRDVAKVLHEHRDVWSMFYFGGDSIIIFPATGKDEGLAKLFRIDEGNEHDPAPIWSDDVRWQEVEGKRYLWAWWD